jgi:hypothetical protein
VIDASLTKPRPACQAKAPFLEKLHLLFCRDSVGAVISILLLRDSYTKYNILRLKYDLLTAYRFSRCFPDPFQIGLVELVAVLPRTSMPTLGALPRATGYHISQFST